jgi:trk system potassium uptake protein TrkA
VQWTIERVLRRILPDAPSVEWIDPSAKVCLIERLVPKAWAGHRVEELEVVGQALVVALARLGVAQLARPDLVIQDGDVVFVAIAGDHINEFDEHIGAGVTGGGH